MAVAGRLGARRAEPPPYPEVKGTKMQTYDLKITGDKLVLTIDLNQQGRVSGTGKTILVSSSNGIVAVDYPKRPGMKIGWNLMVPNR
jgi:hypothetical protein